MSKLLVALHGNPGDSSDFDMLLNKLAIDTQANIIVPRRPVAGADLDRLSIAIEANIALFTPSEVTVIAYSWGCYLACWWLVTSQCNITKLILISPTIVAENPLSWFAIILTKLPVIGNLLLKKIAKTKSHEFIEKSFYPQQASVQDRASLYNKLNNPLLWRGAIRYKYQQQARGINKLKPIDNINTIIIRGTLDNAANWPMQQQALRRLFPAWDKVCVHAIQHAGHALPWTATNQLVQIIQSEIGLKTTHLCSSMEYSSKQDQHNVVSFLKQHAQRTPRRIALRWALPDEVQAFSGDVTTKFNANEINYADLYQRIGCLAQGLAELGLHSGDRVIVFLPMSLEMYVAMFAIQYIGAIAVFLDSWARRNQLGASARCVTPRAMISHKRAFDVIAGIPELDAIPLRIIAGPGYDDSFCAQLETLLATPGRAAMSAVNPDDTALITFTTGSSGEPKGANRTHRFLYAQHAALTAVVPYRDQATDIPAFPIFSLNNLASGITTVLPAIDLARPHPNDAAALVSQVLHEKITCTTLSPSMLNGLSDFCRRSNIQLASIQRVITGGAPISRDNVRDFHAIAPAAEIWILYGSTEVEPMAHIEAKEMLALENHPDVEIVEEGVNVGHIAPGLNYKFIKPYKDAIDFAQFKWEEWEVRSGEVGEFIVAGDHVCADYYNNNNAFFRTKIRAQDGTVWHRTGDLARLDERGYLWVVGRVHTMICRQGQNFYPVKAEVLLNRCSFIKKAAFLGIDDGRLGERTAVVVEFCAGFQDKPAGIKEILRLFHKNKLRVDSLYEVDAIPMDPRHHSKVEYGLLRTKLHAERIKDLLAQQKKTLEKIQHALTDDSF